MDTAVRNLLSWYKQNGRHKLPWRKTRDPYRVMVSELMLQQTQVSRVIPKYNTFLKLFPTIEALAAASRADVLHAWQGLGYNSRAVRLRVLAKLVVEEHAGVLPATKEGLEKLPGIGSYTAGAIMIFSHDAPEESVDVNVARVLRRVFFTKRQRPDDRRVRSLAHELIVSSERPHDWHSALMDLGSQICTAKAPSCSSCPVYQQCETRGVRHDERVRTQPTFQGSNRWWRGRILKLILARKGTDEEILAAITETPTADEKNAFHKALKSMLAEGIVQKKGQRYVV